MNSLQLQGIGDVRLHNEPVLTPRNIEVAGDQGAVDTAVATYKPGRTVILCGTDKRKAKSRHSAMITQQLQGLNDHKSKSLKEAVNHKLFINLV